MQDMLGDWHIERAALARAFPSARSVCDSDQPLDAATLLLELGLSPLTTMGAPRRGRTPSPHLGRGLG